MPKLVIGKVIIQLNKIKEIYVLNSIRLSIGAYMGEVMAKFKGKISGKEIMDVIKKYVKW